jgi:hypothetical protein
MQSAKSQGRYLRYRNKTAPCARCRRSHGVLAMAFDMERAIEDGARELARQIDADLLKMLGSAK